MKKIAIIGSSIAGSTLAYLLAKSGCDVVVFEQKKQNDMGRKACANIVTPDFVKIIKKLNLYSEGIIKNSFKRAIFFSKNNNIELPIDDYEIDREAFLKSVIRKAKAEGAKFNFGTRFLGFKEYHGYYVVDFKKGSKIISERADYVVGADGALSKIASRIMPSNKKAFWLATQARIPKKPSKDERDKYFIFFSSRFGYYSYIFPSKEYFTIGTLSIPQEHRKFNDFLNHLGIKNIEKKEAALIPIYNPIMRLRKGNILIIGDAAGMTKFTGGGIVPALKAAVWASDAVLGRKSKMLNRLRKELFLHHIIYRGLRNLSDTEFDRCLKLVDNGPISHIGSRDNASKWILKILGKKPGLIRILPRLF